MVKYANENPDYSYYGADSQTGNTQGLAQLIEANLEGGGGAFTS